MKDTTRSDFVLFAQALHERLEKGEQEYGDASFERAEDEILGELQEEVLDLAGWGFILWTRLDRLKTSLENVPRGFPKGAEKA